MPLLEMTTPAPAIEYISLEPKFCENCGRGFCRRQGSKTVFCNPCRVMYQEESSQLWHCLTCGTERKFGDFRPELTRDRRLRCNHCACVTEHEFSRMSPRSLQ